jgi:hypothetical protein
MEIEILSELNPCSGYEGVSGVYDRGNGADICYLDSTYDASQTVQSTEPFALSSGNWLLFPCSALARQLEEPKMLG